MATVYWWSVGYGAIVVFVSPASTWTGTVCQGFVGMVLTLAVIFSLALLCNPDGPSICQS